MPFFKKTAHHTFHGLVLPVFHTGRWCLRWLLRLGILAFILLLVLLTYLHVAGLPLFLHTRMQDELADYGLFIQFSRLAFELDRGLVAKDIRLFESPEAPTPFFSAERMAIMPDPVGFFRRHTWIPILEVENGRLLVDLAPEDAAPGLASRTLTLSDIHARASIHGSSISLQAISANFLGIELDGRGTYYLAPKDAIPATLEAEREASIRSIADAFAALRRLPPGAATAVEHLNQVAFQAPPVLQFAFASYAAHPRANRISLQFDSPRGGTAGPLAFQSAALRLRYAEQILRLQEGDLQLGKEHLRLAATWNIPGNSITAEATSTCTPESILPLLPPDIQVLLRQEVSPLHFPLMLQLTVPETKIADMQDFAELLIEKLKTPTLPAPDSAATTKTNTPILLQGRLHLADATIHGLPIERLEAAFALTEDLFTLTRVDFRGGPGHTSRITLSQATLDTRTLAFQAHAAGSADPAIARPFLTENQREYLDWLVFEAPVTSTNLHISGRIGSPFVNLSADVETKAFTLNGVAFQSAEATVEIDKDMLHATGLHLARTEGRLTGDLHLSFPRQTLLLDVDSTLDLQDAGNMLGPVVSNFMSQFHFEGPVSLEIEGLLDYCNLSLNNIRIHAEASQGHFGLPPWFAEALAFDLYVQGHRLSFENIRAKAYQGSATAKAFLYPVGGDSRWFYAVEAAGANLSFANIMASVMALNASNSAGTATQDAAAGNALVEALRGNVDANIRVTGFIGDGEGHTVQGYGDATIRNGHLFQLPLFNGLSSLFSRLIPGFSLFAQTDAKASFVLADSKITTRDAQILGSLFSAQGSGSCSFDGTLDFGIDVRLLRGGGIFSTLLRILTLPVTRLFQYTVDGTLEEPTWHPTNFDPAKILRNPATLLAPLNPVGILSDSANIIKE